MGWTPPTASMCQGRGVMNRYEGASIRPAVTGPVRGYDRPFRPRSSSCAQIMFATDSPLEENGFEPSVPPQDKRLFSILPFSPLRHHRSPERPTRFRERDRQFESPSLQRRVRCEPLPTATPARTKPVPGYYGKEIAMR